MRNLGRESNTITIATFYENYLLNKYNFDPACQRRSVWDEERESFLIDSIIKNFSIPPIFLHQKIDDDTGKTIYDVIDGKQRLNSIIKFIENKIPLPDNFSDDNFGDRELNGLKFEDFNSVSADYKKLFWRYNIPVEYIDTEDENTINAVFDRLNRNGIPLNPQELRNAEYNNTNLMKLINDLSEQKFWKNRFINPTRMEDKEFISELILVILENKIFNANPKDIDSLYNKYKDISEENKIKVISEFEKVTNNLDSLEIDYKEFNLGVSHIYAVWCFCLFSLRNNVDVMNYKEKLKELYTQLRNKDKGNNDFIKKYFNSINGGASKSKAQRKRRVESIFQYCEIDIRLD